MAYLSRVQMPISAPLSCPEATAKLDSAGILAFLSRVDSVAYPGGLDFAVIAAKKPELEKAKRFLAGLGWRVGVTEQYDGGI